MTATTLPEFHPSVALRYGAALEAGLEAQAGPIQRHYGGLLSLVLVGSMARGEASWISLPDGAELLGDADVLLVFDPDRRLPNRHQLAAWEAAITRELLRSGIRAQVALCPVSPEYFASLPPHIFACEMKRTGRVLWGSDAALRCMPNIPLELPREDAWRLLTNRIVELTPSACALRGRRCRTVAEAYPWVKLYLDMATSFLVFTGDYEPTYRGRLQRLLAHPERWASGELGATLPAGMMHRVAECTAWKLEPAQVPRPLARAGATAQAVRDAKALWCWQLQQLTGAPDGLEWRSLWRLWLKHQSLRAWSRGWASATLRTGRGAWRLWPRWAGMCLGTTPRHLIYRAAAELFFSCGSPSAASMPLPLHPRTQAQAPGLRAQAVLHNYRLLVETTRA